MDFKHISVLLNESIEGLDIKPEGIYIDGTLGGGGHSLEILKRLTTGRLIAFDKDEQAIAASKIRLAEYLDKVTFVHDDFKNAIDRLDELNIDKIDGVMLDLGVSSYQLDNDERGFSYNADAKLDMRMDTSQEFSAYEVVNQYEEHELANIIWEYGEDRLSRRIASNIVKAREEKSIETTSELAKIVENSYPAKLRWKGGNPCKRTFQAIRIEVNSELKDLDKIIINLGRRLNIDGRMCIITFHSLEDRIVKRAYQYLEKDCICPPEQPFCTCDKVKEIEIITRKPIEATKEELENNSRAASAKLRIMRKI